MNGIIIVNKPSGWTSNDVVVKLKGVLRERRIGHGGTLDPMATGVLPVFVGRATRAVQFCESADKDYTAGLRLGIETDTQDITGNVLNEEKTSVTEEQLKNVLQSFIGAQKQIPPMYSAVKIGGKKLYELARKGRTVEREPRDITIKKLELIGRDGEDYIIDVTCSKGTYIRTIANDIGKSLGTWGVMSSLVRTRAGEFRLSDAHTLEKIISMAADGRAQELLLPVDSLFSQYPEVVINPQLEAKCRCGNDLKINVPFEGRCRVYGENGSFLMLGYGENGVIKTVKSFFEV